MPPQQPQGIPIMPTPQAWGVEATDDGEFIMLAVDTPIGGLRFLVNHEAGAGLHKALGVKLDQAKSARSGTSDLAVPSQVLLGPDGQPAAVVPPNLQAVPPLDDEDAGRRGD